MQPSEAEPEKRKGALPIRQAVAIESAASHGASSEQQTGEKRPNRPSQAARARVAKGGIAAGIGTVAVLSALVLVFKSVIRARSRHARA